MDVRAIVILADAEAETSYAGTETFGGRRLAAMDVLGETPAERVARQLQRYGVQECAVVCDSSELKNLETLKPVDAGDNPWRAAETVFNDFVQKDTDVVLIVRLGPYTEINFEELVQFHAGHRSHVTVAVDPQGNSLDVFAVSASRRNEAAFLLRHGLRALRSPAGEFVYRGYVNRLVRAVDLRQLAVDAFLRRNAVQPVGEEVRPGVWIGPGARIHRRARIVAPAFIGAHARVRAAAVITRFSVVEHHAEIDCGTVVENSSIAPLMYIGAGLEISWSVVGLGQTVASLRRGHEVEIVDPKLIATISASAPMRVLTEAASLTAFLPAQLFRGLFSRSKRKVPAPYAGKSKTAGSIPVDSPFSTPGELSEAGEFSPNLAVARRYGNE